MRTKRLLRSFLSIATIILIFVGNANYNAITANASNISVSSYTGSASVTLNNNVPSFDSSTITNVSFEQYGEFDALSRCTAAIACIGTDLMPTTERESIGSVKPTGWNQNKYPGVVDSEPPYLYNRCHLIGYQLSGENANEKNLVTGTRYMNVEGMLPYENTVASYVKSTGNHVMYRATPIFEGNNLLCSGVILEAYSVEDSGAGVCFNVFCFNVQPGVIINYADGSNVLDESYIAVQDNPDAEDITRSSTSEVLTEGSAASANYIANKNTKKFHYPSCDSVSEMKESNKLYFEGTRDELISQGYSPCKRCNP